MTGKKWIVIRIDGKIAGVSTDYRILARISEHLATQAVRKPGQTTLYGEISAVTTDIDQVWKLRKEVKWDDLLLFGTDFQKKVWRKLWDLTHVREGIPGQAGDDKEAGEDNTRRAGDDTRKDGDDGRKGQEHAARLVCYSDFADLCQNRAGVRAVAHAIGLNPVSVIIPCHLIIPKEGIDKMREIHNKAQATIFKGDDLCMNSILNDSAIDFGEYALGKTLKRELIIREMTENDL